MIPTIATALALLLVVAPQDRGQEPVDRDQGARDQGGQAPKKKSVPTTVEGVAVPQGKNPIAWLVDRERRSLPKDWAPELGNVVTVHLPPGRIPGASFKTHDGSSPLAKVSIAWLGAATLEIKGHPDGTTIQPMHDQDGWGLSLEIRPHADWDGRIHFHDLTIEASGASAVDMGVFGSQEMRPLLDVRFYRCRFLDHPSDQVTTNRPISANQASIHFEECFWDLPNSEEHAVYSRNPVGPASMINCTVKACGGQVWQEVSRPDEGPNYPPEVTLFEGNRFEGYHRNPGRAGAALTNAGASRYWVVRDCVVMDLEPSPLTGPPDTTNGGFVTWDGGRYYDLDGKPVHTEQDKDLHRRYANRKLLVEGCLFVQKNPNRSPFQITSLEEGIVRDTGIFATRPVDLIPFTTRGKRGGDPLDAGIGRLEWRGNNRPHHRERALALGVPEALLQEPGVRLKQNHIGPVSRDFTVVGDHRVESEEE